MVVLRIKSQVPLEEEPGKPEVPQPRAPAPAAPPAAASWEALDRPVLAARTRLIAGAVLGALCLAALAGFWQGALIGLLAALALSSALLPAVRWLGDKKKIPLLQALPLLYGLVCLALALVLLVWLPAWQRQAQTYGRHVTELTRRWTARAAALPPAAAPPAGITNAIPEASAQATNAVTGSAADAEVLARLAEKTVHEQLAKGAQQAADITKRLQSQTEASVAQTTRAIAKASGRRWSIFFQLVLFTAGFLAIPLLAPRAAAVAPGVWGRLGAWVVAGYRRAAVRLGVFCGCRILSATALSLLTAIGLMLAGLDVAWFLAGCVGILSLGLRCGPSLGLALALPMIPLASSWPLALGAVAVLWAALIVAEKRLYWYLQYLPALKAGWMPPPPAGGRFFAGLLGGAAGLLMRGLLSLALLLTLAGFLYCVLPPYLADQDRAEALNEAAAVYAAHHPVESIAHYSRLLQKYPNERVLLLGLARSCAEAGDGTNALAWAERAVNWQAAPPPAPTLPARVYNVAMGFRARPPLIVRPVELYEYLARQLMEPGRAFPPPPVARELGEKLLKQDDQNAWGHLLMAAALVQEKNYPETISHVQRGLAAKNSDTEQSLQLLLARARAEQKAPTAPPDKP